MKHLSLMLKPASSLCNMRCSYCFYADVTNERTVQSYGMMQPAVVQALVANVFSELQDGDTLLFAFQGGEPTLAGLPFFKHFVSVVAAQPKKVKVSYALQTNGLCLDDAWFAFLHQHHFLVGLSIDGYEKQHDKNRVDAAGEGTFQRVLTAKRAMDKARVEYNVLCTLTNGLARRPVKTWEFLVKENIRFVQFTPCLGKLSGQPDEWALTPQRFYTFYLEIFALWKQQIAKGNYISVKLFDDIVNQFVRREITSCGMHGHCQMQYVVEADGSTYPCDFYVLDEYNGGNLAKQPFAQVTQCMQEKGFLQHDRQLPATCVACQYRNACNGGCKRMRHAMYLGVDGFCGYQQLLDAIGQELCQIGQWMLQQNS